MWDRAVSGARWLCELVAGLWTPQASAPGAGTHVPLAGSASSPSLAPLPAGVPDTSPSAGNNAHAPSPCESCHLCEQRARGLIRDSQDVLGAEGAGYEAHGSTVVQRTFFH